MKVFQRNIGPPRMSFGRNKQDAIWFIGQFRSTTMKDSRRRVISHAFRWEHRHCCNSEPPCVSIRSNEREINWFTGQFRSTNMKDSRRRVISHAFGWERRHYCNSERPHVSIHSNDREINWFTGQFRTTNMNDSRSSVIFSCFEMGTASLLLFGTALCINIILSRHYEIVLWNEFFVVGSYVFVI